MGALKTYREPCTQRRRRSSTARRATPGARDQHHPSFSAPHSRDSDRTTLTTTYNGVTRRLRYRTTTTNLCVRPHTYADNVALPAFARRRCCSNRSISFARRAHSSKPEAAGLLPLAHAGTDRQTDGRTDGHRTVSWVYETVRCQSVCLYVCMFLHGPTAANPLLQVCCRTVSWVYETVRCQSVRPSVCLQVCCCSGHLRRSSSLHAGSANNPLLFWGPIYKISYDSS